MNERNMDKDTKIAEETRTVICDNCHGRGWHDHDGDKLDDEGSEKCAECNGTGRKKVQIMVPSKIAFTVNQKEISGDFTFKCKIDNPFKERINVRDYVYDIAKKELIDHYDIAHDDVLEITETYFYISNGVMTKFQDYIICEISGKFKTVKKYIK